jgi:hypothetical protein
VFLFQILAFLISIDSFVQTNHKMISISVDQILTKIVFVIEYFIPTHLKSHQSQNKKVFLIRNKKRKEDKCNRYFYDE